MLEMKLIKSVAEEPKLPQDNKDLMAYCAYDSEVLVGYCLFAMEENTIVLYDLASDPKDYGVVDGLGRAAINYADKEGKTYARSAGGKEELDIFTTTVGVFAGNTAKITELFTSCDLYNADGAPSCADCPIAGNCNV